jgi:glutamate-1-semialdehyde aminotransferase
MRVEGFPGVFGTLFGIDPDVVQYDEEDAASFDTDMNVKFWQAMAKEGIYIGIKNWFPSIVHAERDTNITLEAADKVMATL